MKVVVGDYRSISKKIAEEFIAVIQRKPNAVLGLATGTSPLQVYADLVEANKAGRVSFKNVTTFGMSGRELDIKNEEIVRQAKRLNHFYLHKEEKEVAYNIEELEEEWKKTKIFDKWSNIYNVSAIPAKIRSVGGEKYIAANLEVLAEAEHNRWNVEKLLMGFRPATDDEHKLIKADAKKKNEYKDRFIHDDIRPFSELDDASKDIDRKLIEHIPDIKRR